MAELAVQFNAMADRLQESVEIIRRDRDRSRDFLADVSHELRTPLAALRTFNELLKEGAADDPEARAEFLESSGQQIERLDWLAQNLLELSKLDSGLVLLDLRPDDLRAAVETAVEQTRAAARRRGIDPRAASARRARSGSATTRSGSARWSANLVANAVKFTPRGGSVSVDVAPTAGRGTDRGRRHRASASTPTELPHIFERFYRGSRANEARGSGSGLGLAIVRSIVDMHGGTVEVESRVGQWLAVHRDAARAIRGSSRARRRPNGPQSPPPPMPGRARVPPDRAPPLSSRRHRSANMQETSPSDPPKVNPEPAP